MEQQLLICLRSLETYSTWKKRHSKEVKRCNFYWDSEEFTEKNQGVRSFQSFSILSFITFNSSIRLTLLAKKAQTLDLIFLILSIRHKIVTKLLPKLRHFIV